MSKKIQLTIPEPCHEDWDKMNPVEKGRFCDSCQKQVVDFSTMSDHQIAAFFKKPSTGSVCGRFMTDQLDRQIEIPKKRIPWLKYFFQIALPAFFVSKASAQNHKIGKIAATKGTTAVVTPDIKNTNEKDPAICIKSADDTLTPPIIMQGAVAYVEERGLKGLVVDAETGLPVTGVYMEMNSSIGNEMISVKYDGSFVLNIYRKIHVNYVEVSKPGYVSQKIKYKDLQKAADGTVLVKLKKEMMLKGEIAVNTCRQPIMGDIDPVVMPVNSGIVSGKVVNENNEPVPYASIQAGNVMNFFIADENGEFEINRNEIPGEKILIVSAAGYENASVKAEQSNIKDGKLIITLKLKEMLPEVVVTSGTTVVGRLVRVSIGAVSISKKEIIINKQLPQQNAGEKELLVYPNPLPSGATLNLSIKFSRHDHGYFRLQLLSMSGQQVFKQDLFIDEEARVMSIDLPYLTAGNYVAVLISKQTSKKWTEKVVVQ